MHAAESTGNLIVHAVNSVKQERIVDQVREVTITWFGEEQWESMRVLVTKESGFNPFARNPTSGACGIFQALPCRKLPCPDLADVKCQADWGANYIRARYGTPSNALQFHLRNNWY